MMRLGTRSIARKGGSSHLEGPRRLTVPVEHVTHVAVRAREHVAGVPAYGTLELVEYAVVLVQITELRGERKRPGNV